MTGKSRLSHAIRAILGAGLVTAFGASVCAAQTALPPPPTDPRDMSGVWFGVAYHDPNNFYFKPVEGGEPPFTPAGRKLFAQRRALTDAGKPTREPATECMPHGTPHVISTPTPFQVIQTPGQVTFIHEASRNVRLVYLDEPQPQTVEPTFLGHSVGRWEGDTLLVDTVGIRDEPWLDFGGSPGGEGLHVVERWRKIDNNTKLEVLISISNPEYYSRTWSARREFYWSPEERIREYICEEFDRIEPGSERNVFR